MSQSTELVSGGQSATQQADRATMTPDVDIMEDAAGITLLADMPGVSKDRLNVRVESDRLFIEGEVSISIPEALKVFHSEMSNASYQRTFVLGREFDRANIDANLKDGVLTLRIPRLQEAQPKRIEVKLRQDS
jgi:HSP20 family protein